MERVYTAPLLDKLGIRPGMRVAILGALEDEDEIAGARPDGPRAEADDVAGSFRARPGERTSDITLGRPKPDSDVVLVAADTTADLDVLGEIRSRIRPAGGIWVVSRKGKAATLRDVEVMAAASEHGLVDNKVVAVSARRTAIRLVIPIALRPKP